MSGQGGRPRDPNIPNEVRRCAHHGLTDFRGYTQIRPSGAKTLKFVCARCQADRALAAYYRRTGGA